MTFTTLSRNILARPGVLVLTAGVLLALLILLILLPLPLAVDADEGGARIHFEADRRWVALPGGCVTLRWQAEGIREIYLDGEGTAILDEAKARHLRPEGSALLSSRFCPPKS